MYFVALACFIRTPGALYAPVFLDHGYNISNRPGRKIDIVRDDILYTCLVPDTPSQNTAKATDEVFQTLLSRLISTENMITFPSPVAADDLSLTLFHFARMELSPPNGEPLIVTVPKHAFNTTLKKQRFWQVVLTPQWEVHGVREVEIQYVCERFLDDQSFTWKYQRQQNRLTLKHGTHEACHMSGEKGRQVTRIECAPI